MFCDYAGSLFVQSAVLISVLFALDWLARKRVRAVLRYCLWMLVLAKLILPPTLALPTGIGYWLGDRLPTAPAIFDSAAPAPGIARANRTLAPEPPASGEVPHGQGPGQVSEAASPVASTDSGLTPMTWQGILLLLWLMGVLAFTVLLLQRLRFVRGLIAFSSPADARFQRLMMECGAQIGIRRDIELRASNTMSSPALCGLLTPVVVVPARILETLAPDKLKAILMHELAHMKRGDLWINSLQTLLQVLYFYNPFVWFANAMIRRTREEAVDETVLVALGGQARDYSDTLIDIGEMVLWKADLGLRLIGVAESERILRWRIKHMLTRPIPKSSRLGVMGTVILTVMAALFLPMARGQRPGLDSQPTSPPEAETHLAMTTEGRVAPRVTSAPGDKTVFIDSNTGIRFTKFTTITGPSDVIPYDNVVNLSPNGKFVMSAVHVIPLDGSSSFKLTDMPNADRGAWSPDGKKVVFSAVGAIWLIEVDPETGRALGPARKLSDEHWYFSPAQWSPDSQRIVVRRRDNPRRDAIWALSIDSGDASKIADPFTFTIVSPDGKTIACRDGQAFISQASLVVKSTVGGQAKKIADGVHPIRWSTDSKWLVCTDTFGMTDEIGFVRATDGRTVEVKLPLVGCIVYASPHNRNLFFYQSSYDEKTALKVVSVTGGPPAELGWPHLSHENWAGYQSWTQDSRSILVEGTGGEDKRGLWAVPLDGKAPRPLTIDAPLWEEGDMRLFSPNGSNLLLVKRGLERTLDLWTVPVSLAQLKSTGPAIKAFEGIAPWPYIVGAHPETWSPDGSKIAFHHDGDIWVAGADGKHAIQLTQTAEGKGFPIWSPDSTMLAFLMVSPTRGQLRVVPASGGEERVIFDLKRVGKSQPTGGNIAWLPNGREITVNLGGRGIIASFPLAGGEPRTVARLTDLGVERAGWMKWSLDGQFLAFQGVSDGEWKLYVYQPDSGKLQQLTDDDDIEHYYWSPNSKWISFYTTQPVKTRPEGVLWEMDIEEALDKLAR